MKYIYIILVALLVVGAYVLFGSRSDNSTDTVAEYYIENITSEDDSYKIEARSVDGNTPITLHVFGDADITFVSDPYYELVRLGVFQLNEDSPDFQPIGTMNFYAFVDALQDQELQIQDTIISSLPFEIKISDNSITNLKQIYLP